MAAACNNFFPKKVKTFADQVDISGNLRTPQKRGNGSEKKKAYHFGGPGFDLIKSSHAVTAMHNICQ